MIVYIACPIDLTAKEFSLPDKAAEELLKKGINVYMPWRALACSGPDPNRQVRQINLAAIDAASAVLVFLTKTMSWGSVVDVEHALDQGVPVVMHVSGDIEKLPYYIDPSIPWSPSIADCIKMLEEVLPCQTSPSISSWTGMPCATDSING